MAYISLPRKEADNGNSLLLPSDGVITVNSSAATNCVVKYNAIGGSSADNCLQYAITIDELGDETMTRDIIVDRMIAALSVAGGGNGPAIPVDFGGNSVSGITISMGTL